MQAERKSDVIKIDVVEFTKYISEVKVTRKPDEGRQTTKTEAWIQVWEPDKIALVTGSADNENTKVTYHRTVDEAIEFFEKEVVKAV